MTGTKKGFTLVEILITVLVIAILVLIAIPNLLRARIEAHDAAAKSALKAISTALETYSSVQNQYPTNISSLVNVDPPYLTVDYFTGTHSGFTFTSTLTAFTYSATAAPAAPNLGSGSFTISTGGILVEN